MMPRSATRPSCLRCARMRQRLRLAGSGSEREEGPVDERSQGTMGEEDMLEVAYTGRSVLENPLLNKGSAFSPEERQELGLVGLLPPHVANMEVQLERVYAN